MDDARIADAIERLSDPWKPIRNEAAEELARMGEAVIPHLARLLEGEHPDHDLAQYAVWVLETLDTPACEVILEEFWSRHG